MSFQKILQTQAIICLFAASAFCLGSCAPAARIKGDDVHDLQLSAQSGDANAQTLIGLRYEFGADVPANALIAAQWYALAARQGHPDAELYLGAQYEQGQALHRNPAEALKWLFHAAEKGQERAQLLLAALYLKDRAIRPDIAKKLRAYRQGAEKGDAASQYQLGWMSAQGVGLPANEHEALKWHLKAARQGHALAWLALGDIYFEGKGTPANLQEAQAWYSKSAETDLRGRVKLCQLQKGAGGSPENAGDAGKCRHAVMQNIDASLRFDLNRQSAVLKTEKEKHPALALRACRRLAEFDPAYGEVSQMCDALARQVGERMDAPFQEAQSALAKKEWSRFRDLLAGLLTPDVDEGRLKRLMASAWQFIEAETHAKEKIARDLLKSIEAAERSAVYRKKNAHQIPRLINAFNATLSSALSDHPADATLAALARKGKRLIASLQQKMKALRLAEEKAAADLPEDVDEGVEPGEDEYKEAHALFNKGRFEEAAALFNRTTRIRDSRYIASAYVYLGIIHLARINPAHVNEARKRHLKGLACFQNALRFDGGIALPEGFGKYQPVFDEAKQRLH